MGHRKITLKLTNSNYLLLLLVLLYAILKITNFNWLFRVTIKKLTQVYSCYPCEKAPDRKSFLKGTKDLFK